MTGQPSVGLTTSNMSQSGSANTTRLIQIIPHHQEYNNHDLIQHKIKLTRNPIK